MTKSKIFWIVFIISVLISAAIFYSSLKSSYLNDIGRYVDYNTANRIWYKDFDTNISGITFLVSVVVGLLLGGISTIFVPKKNKEIHPTTTNAVKSEKYYGKKSINSAEFIGKIRKLNQLFLSGIYNEEEYINRKQQILSELTVCDIAIPSNNFLFDLIPLKEECILTDDDVTKIKMMIVK